MIGFLIFCGVIVSALYVWKQRRANVRAGRIADRPTYSIEPPHRRVGSRRTETL